jgi:hypothetical protein
LEHKYHRERDRNTELKARIESEAEIKIKRIHDFYSTKTKDKIEFVYETLTGTSMGLPIKDAIVKSLIEKREAKASESKEVARLKNSIVERDQFYMNLLKNNQIEIPDIKELPTIKSPSELERLLGKEPGNHK